jgi:peptidyl-prolyl cis-trans isomerase B (cyclophilin B)
VALSIVGLLVVVAVVVLFAVTTGHDHSSTPPAGAKSTSHSAAPTSSANTTAAAAGNCAYTQTGSAAKKVTLPPGNEPTTGTTKATVATSQGTMTFSLDRAHAPCAVGSFVSLAKQKYFDSTPCHRLTTSGIFVLQCGDPTGTGSGGPGYSFKDELTGKEKYTRGVLAMANSGPNTNGSQFFIVYKDSQLGPQYTVFGKVSGGLNVVDKVAKAGVTGGGTDGKPALPVTIKKVTVAA